MLAKSALRCFSAAHVVPVSKPISGAAGVAPEPEPLRINHLTEVHGNLVIKDYKSQTPILNENQDIDGEPVIYQFVPHRCWNSTIGNPYYSKIKDFCEDFKILGVKGIWEKLRHGREAWYEKGGKVLVGVDRFGNKYWESPDAQAGRERWVDYATGNFWADSSDVPPEWYAWLTKMVLNPPNRIEDYPVYWRQHIPTGRNTGRFRDYYPPGHPFAPQQSDFKKAGNTKVAWNVVHEWDPTAPEPQKPRPPPRGTNSTDQ